MARRTMRRTTIEQLLATSIRLNRLLVPVAAAESTLARYTHQLVAYNDDNDFPVSLVGSSIAVQYRERYLVLCTRHQLRGWCLESISLIPPNSHHVVTSGGVRHFEGVNDTDFHDLVAFDFTEPCLAGALPQEHFFNLAEFPPDAPSDHIVCLICSGYPTENQIYDVQDARRIGQARRVIICGLDGPNQPSDDALMRIRPLDRLDFDPDGMSGGPAFVVQIVEQEPRAYFAGIMTRAGRDHIYIVRSGFARQFMDLWVGSN